MQASNSFKISFLKHMLLGLQLGGVSSKSMTLLERKRAIKISADIAMAAARGGANWSCALLSSLSNQEKSKGFVRSIMGKKYERPTKPSFTLHNQRSKKILRRSFMVHSRIRKGKGLSRGVAASVLAKYMVKKRTQVLRGLIPGGESMDDISLLGETIDYVISLRAQVDLMQLLARTLDDPNLKACSKEALNK